MNEKQKAAEIGYAALDLDEGKDRDDYIARCCGSDRELKRLVLSYVQSCSAISGSRKGRWIGPYQIVEELGHGAMGVVFRGHDPRIGRPIAIKQIRSQFLAPAEQEVLKMRFAREAAAAGKLSHANIVTIHQLGEYEGSQYLVMELVNGPSLDQMLSPGVPMDSNTTLAILRQVADALDYAHGEGVVHRDIKPGNILVLPDGRVKVTDFGIARISSMSTVTQTGMTMGTPAYMAPEQITGAKVDGKADQFSLAVMAFQMMTGSKPFEADSTHALMFKIVSEDPPLLHTVKPSLPPASSEVLKRALGKTPDNRYASCLEFVKSLAGALEERKSPPASVPLPDTGLPVTVLNTAVPIKAEAAEPARRKMGFRSYVLGVAGLMALVGVAAVAYKLSRDSRPAQTTPAQTIPTPTATVPGGKNSAKPSVSVEAIPPGPRPTEQPRQTAEAPDLRRKAISEPDKTSNPGKYDLRVDESGLVKPFPTPTPAAVVPAEPPPNTHKLDDQMTEGKKLYDSGRCQDAAALFDNLARAEPENAPVRNSLGLAYMCLHMMKPAADSFAMAIKIRPNYAAAYLNRGQIYLGAGQYDLAIQDFTWGIEQEPQNASLYWRRGRALLGTRRYEDAMSDFERSIKLAPSDAHGYHGRGKIFHQLGKYREALNDYAEAIFRKNDFAAAYADRATTRERLGDKAGAAADREFAKRYAGHD